MDPEQVDEAEHTVLSGDLRRNALSGAGTTNQLLGGEYE